MKILVTGGTGMVGSGFKDIESDHDFVLVEIELKFAGMEILEISHSGNHTVLINYYKNTCRAG